MAKKISSNHVKIVVGLLTVFLTISLVFNSFTGADDISSPQDIFARCLTDNSMVLYGAYWCSHCKNQKEMFGSSFEYIEYVECTDNEFKCKTDGVSGYPTWKDAGGKNYPGEKTFEVLSQISGCPLPA